MESTFILLHHMAEVKALPISVDWHNSSGQVGVLPFVFMLGIQIPGLLFMCVEYSLIYI